MNRAFKLKFTYFKQSGKYYTDGDAEWVLTRLINDSAYMQDAVDRVLKERREGISAPGLMGTGVDFHVVVNCEEGHPCLITAGRTQ